MKKTIVGVIGGTISGNRGAEAMLVTVVGKIHEKFPDAEIKIFSYYPKQDRLLVNLPSIEILSCKPISLVLRFFPFALLAWLFQFFRIRLPDSVLTKPIRTLRTCAVLVDISGVSFVGGREIFLPFNILSIWPAMMLGVPVVKFAQALGPFTNPMTRAMAKVFLPGCARIFARGEITAAHLQTLNLGNISRAADVAFLFKDEYSLSNENEEKNNKLDRQLSDLKNSGVKIIAIAPSSLVYQSSLKAGKDYVQALLNLVSHFAGEDVHFLFLPNSNREVSKKSRNNDLFILEILRERFLSSFPESIRQRMSWVLWDANTRDLRRLMSYSDLLMTSRFHAMIAGLALAVPTLVIGWSHKYMETLADFGLERFAADFDDSSLDIIHLAEEILGNQEQFQSSLKAQMPRVKELAESQFDFLEGVIRP
jgi:colanic acid/amylovoran biosynthesis protein